MSIAFSAKIANSKANTGLHKMGSCIHSIKNALHLLALITQHGSRDVLVAHSSCQRQKMRATPATKGTIKSL